MEKEVRERIAARLRGSGDGSSIACARALAIAEQEGVNPREVGRVCNEEGIKITRCQLGCFGWGGGE